ncbi:MAG TPA: LapA family protein [Actinospica sp.]|nr:LapA family protein [Actinospica sp.]
MSANIPPVGAPEPERKERSRLAARLATPKVFIGGIITIAAVWFIIANNSRVRIHLWVTYVSARLWLVLLLTFVAGALVGFLTGRRRRKGERR